MTPSEQTDLPATIGRPAARRRRGAPRPWAWVATGALVGFALLGGYSLRPGAPVDPTSSVLSSVMYTGIVGALLGGLLGAVVLAVVVGRGR